MSTCPSTLPPLPIKRITPKQTQTQATTTTIDLPTRGSTINSEYIPLYRSGRSACAKGTKDDLTVDFDLLISLSHFLPSWARVSLFSVSTRALFLLFTSRHSSASSFVSLSHSQSHSLTPTPSLIPFVVDLYRSGTPAGTETSSWNNTSLP